MMLVDVDIFWDEGDGKKNYPKESAETARYGNVNLAYVWIFHNLNTQVYGLKHSWNVKIEDL